jgi:alcohol dehydrogenase (cytochrome c)
VGNPAPDWNGDVRPGDNLYTCALVALDAKTGKLKWHFQFTPHDVHDWDANQIPVLVDAELDGRPRKLVVMANRNAYYYVLDREVERSCWRLNTRSRRGRRIDERGRWC